MSSDPVHSKHLISIHQPKLWLASGAVILFAILIIIWSAFEYGRFVAGFDQADYDEEIDVLRSALNEQTTKKEAALRNNARLAIGSDIQKDASSKINDTLEECQAETLKMKEELTFYHNIVSPGKSKREIKINNIAFQVNSDGSYAYKIVLIQIGRHDYTQRGYIEISFQGKKADGSEVRLDLPTVSVKKAVKRQKFGFKYFQNFEGGIRFPEGFEPLSVFIKAQPKSAKVPKVEKNYAWGDLISRGSEANVGQEKIKLN